MTPNEFTIEAATWIRSVEYLNYKFFVSYSMGRHYLQATYMDQDVYTGILELQHTRKWLLSNEMTKSEVVQTAFKCALTSAEHRCRESFKYEGQRIFGPHFDVDDLATLCKVGRDNAGGRK